MEREIIFSKKVEIYLNELMMLLFEEGYFGFPDSAKSYVDRLILFAENHTGILPGKIAPDYFKRFGQNLKYITYRANKKHRGIFFIRNVTIFI